MAFHHLANKYTAHQIANTSASYIRIVIDFAETKILLLHNLHPKHATPHTELVDIKKSSWLMLNLII